MKKIFVFGILALALALSLTIDATAKGRWVEHNLDDFSGGTSLRDRDEGCLVYTRDNSDIILIFDITLGDWLKVDLGITQSFQDAMTKGNVVFARTDSLLFGYSATLQEWDTLTFTGDYMAATTYYTECGKNLACFVTRSYMYVFDANLGYWQSYAYGLPAEFTGGSVWIADTYVGMKFSLPYPGEPKNVVYSGLTHSFNQIELGVYQPTPITEYGFAGMFNVGYDNETYRLVGYSAVTNQFDVVQYVCGDNEAIISLTGAGALAADMFTTQVYGFRYVVPFTSVTANWYGFDTRRGTWDHGYRFDDWDIIRYYGNIRQAGQFSYDISTYTDDESLHFQFYSGIDGVYRDYSPGLIYKSTTSSWGGGGTVFYARDTLNAWGYDVAGNRGSEISLPLAKTANIYRGENYATLTRYETGVDTMFTFFYNSDANRWTSASAPDYHTTDGIALAHSYLHKGATDNVVVYYSAYTDSIIKEDFPDDISVYIRAKGNMAWARSDGGSVLFDGLRGEEFSYGFDFNKSSMGTHTATLCDTLANILYGYSALTGNESQLVIDFDPYYVLDTGYVGFIENASGLTKCYAYNGLGDGWVELIPEGSDVMTLVGTKTILVERSDRVYGFDPEGDPSDVDEDNPVANLPRVLELAQNHPNPFNPVTQIAFTLPRSTDVRLDIFDILGRKVVTLIDEHMVAGEHELQWDGKDSDGQNASTGIYFYRISTETGIAAKKMLLLK